MVTSPEVPRHPEGIRDFFVEIPRSRRVVSVVSFRVFLRHSLRCACLLLALWLLPLYGYAQHRTQAYMDYVRQYATESIRQMRRHKIPASITLAQGLLESGAGKSTLASVHNNHFGIKCHKSWQGKRTFRDDDFRNECFRSYPTALDSYNDHSNFLKQPRYNKLFKLKPKDYRGWARGLQKAGYATDKGYANKLIALIELYELYELDRERYPAWMQGYKTLLPEEDEISGQSIRKHEGYLSYGLLYFIAEEGDTFTSIAKEVGLKPQKVADYNEAPLDFPLREGDIVYLQEKNRVATPQHPDHVVKIGESMHSIAQTYGMKLHNLYHINGLDMEEYVPTEGDVLLLR